MKAERKILAERVVACPGPGLRLGPRTRPV